MKSDVEVTIDGLPFDQKGVSGISFFYGINTIPTAALKLDAPYIAENAADFLCNPDTYKKRSRLITINVKSKTGCIKFEGYFNGLSINQQLGAIDYTAMVISKFICLREIYPKLVGITPDSFSVYRSHEQFRCRAGDPDAIFRQVVIGKSLALDVNKSVGEFLFEMLKLIVESQFRYIRHTNTTPAVNDLLRLLQENVYKENLKTGMELLAKTDLEAIKNCELRGRQCANSVAERTLGKHENLWDLMISAFGYMGCCLIVANDKIFVLPQVNVMKFDHAVPQYQSSTISNNQANPSQYSNYSVSGDGFVNIKHCLVSTQPEFVPDTAKRLTGRLTQSMGVYPREPDPEIPDDGSNGILIVNTSPFWLTGLNFGYLSDKENSEKRKNGEAFIVKLTETEEEVKKQMKEQNDKWGEDRKKKQKLLDAYAKLKFLQAKYVDRVGQLTTFFNPKWCPATTGSLYSRLPGLFVQFFVTGVTHNIVLSAPNQGSAETVVSYCATRTASSSDKIAGVSKDDFFQYSQADMKSVQGKFISNISGT